MQLHVAFTALTNERQMTKITNNAKSYAIVEGYGK